jgi:uncharacterized protein
MNLDDENESSNFEVQEPSRGGFGFPLGGGGGGLPLGRGGMGCGTIIIILIAVFVFKIDPTAMLGGGGGAPMQQSAPASSNLGSNPGQLTPEQHIALKVLGSTERVWSQVFAQRGERYTPTRLVFYSRDGQSGCGAAQSAMGPFYCPEDQKIYLDPEFFAEMKSKFGIQGDFPMGYVIAHEVGHHLQNLMGISDKVQAAQQRGSRAQGNALSVKLELQADCFAGVWAKTDSNLLEQGDLEEGMRAAHQIGDDVLQRASQGVVVPESFTHGSAEERMRWLKQGLATGDIGQCDTFAR